MTDRTLEELPSFKKQQPFRKAVLRGLGVLMPPLLTIVLFLWAWNIIVSYVLEPIETTVLAVCVMNADVRDEAPPNARPIRFIPAGSPIEDEITNDDSDVQTLVTLYERHDGFQTDQKSYIRIKQKYIPLDVYTAVEDNPGDVAPTTPNAYYHRYFQIRYLQRHKTVPIFLLGFVLVLYLLGKFLAAGVGRWIWTNVENLVDRLPLISNVYSSVKQVTDFAFSQTELQYTRVVAVQYPRKGVWSMGFVTGEGMLDVRMAANEPVMTVLMPTSPMPATGFTITVPKSETIDLNITMDQAIQFCVSCGVVVPRHQQKHKISQGDGNEVNPMLGVGQFIPQEAIDEFEARQNAKEDASANSDSPTDAPANDDEGT